MFTISKEFSFAHNYIVIVEFKSSFLNKEGFVLDYQNLQPIKEYIDNNIDPDINPTAELLAEELFHQFRSLFPIRDSLRLSAVTVKETPDTMARYEPK